MERNPKTEVYYNKKIENFYCEILYQKQYSTIKGICIVYIKYVKLLLQFYQLWYLMSMSQSFADF